MALSKSTLKNDLESYFAEVAELEEAYSHSKTATDIFNIYKDYAMNAEDPSGDNPLVVNLSALSILIASFSSRTVGKGIQSALVAFWTGATFNIVVPHSTMSQETTSIVTGMNPAALDGLFTEEYEDASDAAANMADKLHNFTKSVVVLITGLAKAGSPPPVITASGNLS